MLQTADAALQETQDVLGRMVELTTQAANDTHTGRGSQINSRTNLIS
ncbi:MAG: hypothetical protein ACLR7N_04005 [Roseburia hominis]